MKHNVLLLYGLLIILTSCRSESGQSAEKLSWRRGVGYHWAALKPLHNGKTGFKELKPEQTGISFVNHLTKKDITHNRLLLDGSGVAAGDINGDGLPDLYFTQLDGPNRLYLNEGAFHFEDVTKSAGVALPGYLCSGATFADVDGDGDLDLLVTTYFHGTILFLNDGKGHFTRNRNSGLDSTSVGGTTMTLADINGDGYLDLYVAHYRGRTVRDLYPPAQLGIKKIVEKRQGTFVIRKPFRKFYTIINGKNGPQLRPIGIKDALYLNKGREKGRWLGFQKVTNPPQADHFLGPDGKKIGLFPDWSLTARFEDINGDGLPDLYVCSDFWSPDRVWINQGDGVFKAMDPHNIRHYPFSSMSVAIGDLNNDGSPDLFVTDMMSVSHRRRLMEYRDIGPFPSRVGKIDYQPQYSRNALYLNRGDNTFAETGWYSHVEASDWSWASVFMDVDLDGYQDIIVNNGYSYDVSDLDTQLSLTQRGPGWNNLEKYLKTILEFPSLKTRNDIFRNNGNLTFSDKSAVWGFRDKDVSQGLATADLNNDGVLDIVDNRLNQTAGVYENTTSYPRIAVKLIGSNPNIQAIGAKVSLENGSLVQHRQIVSGGNYLSGSDTQLMFAAGKYNPDRILTITWPNGLVSTIDSVSENRIYKVYQDSIPSHKIVASTSPGRKPVFKDESQQLDYKEYEDSYDDFSLRDSIGKRQPLLPVRLSRQEPGLAWLDYNGDGLPDLFETSGKGGKLAVFQNLGDGKFRKVTFPVLHKAPGDQTAVIGWNTSKGTNIIVGSSNYEQSRDKVASAYHYRYSNGHMVEEDSLPGSPSSTGPLAAADYNRDGTVDLFVGGEFIPGKFPENATSRLYKNINGHFVPDAKNSGILKNVGMVTGAVFTDYNRDGWPDLLLSTSWGKLKLFKNDKGTFRDVTSQVGLDRYKGWWNGVTTGDFNNDGYPDIVATNWGQNSRYQMERGHPLRMYYSDLNSDGITDIIEAAYDTAMAAYVPTRPLNEIIKSVPSFAHLLRSYGDYAGSTLREIIGPSLEAIPYKEINTLQSMVFINNGGKSFSAHPLPRQAQLTPAFNAGVADFNNDGNEDIFLSQNFYDVPRGESRQDAGRGLWLEGDGKGDFKAVPGQISGIKIYGEQRGAALGDYNDDGRVDLAVSQNGNQTKLYLNHTPKDGLRIHLVGPAANKDAIGSSIRLVYKNGKEGPEREIQAGSGYWSQNSFTQVMGTSGDPVQIRIRWFDGKRRTVDIPAGKKNFVIRY